MEKQSVLIALSGVGSLYLIIEFVIPYIKKSINKFKARKEINKLIEKENIDFEEAKAILIGENVRKTYKIDKEQCTIHGITLNTGERISFQDESGKYERGKLLGFKTSKAEGYSFHYVLQKNDNSLLMKPIETIVPNTLNKIS